MGGLAVFRRSRWLAGLLSGDGLQFGGLLLARLGRQGVDLVQGQDFGLVRQTLAIGLQLAANDAVGLDHVVLGAVDKVDQAGRAFDVAQEPRA